MLRFVSVCARHAPARAWLVIALALFAGNACASRRSHADPSQAKAARPTSDDAGPSARGDAQAARAGRDSAAAGSAGAAGEAAPQLTAAGRVGDSGAGGAGAASHVLDAGADDSGNPGSAQAGSAAQDAGARTCVSYESFPPFERQCDSAADCQMVTRARDCCGSLLITAVRASEVSAFKAAVMMCQRQVPICDCPTKPPQADDGSMDDFTNSSVVVVECLDRMCRTRFGRATGSP